MRFAVLRSCLFLPSSLPCPIREQLVFIEKKINKKYSMNGGSAKQATPVSGQCAVELLT